MMSALSGATGVEQITIAGMVRRYETERSFKKKERENTLRQKLALWSRQDKKGIDEILGRLRAEWMDIQKTYSTRTESGPEAYIDAVEEIRETLLTREEISGYRLGHFNKVMTDLGGFPDEGKLILVAGKGNIGKTSWLRFLMLDLIKCNPDELFILFMSIDDSRQDQVPAMIATMKRLTIHESHRPQSIKDPARLQRWEDGFEDLTNGMTKQFTIEDQATGTTIEALESHIEVYREKFPDRKLIVVLDNFHNLTDRTVFSGGNRKREQAIENATELKRIAQTLNIPIVTTCELRKVPPGKRPMEDDIAETGALFYRSDLCLMLHNDLTENPLSDMFWMAGDAESPSGCQKKPILEVMVRKNKISNFKDWWFHKYDNESNYFEEFNEEATEQCKARVLKSFGRQQRYMSRERVDE